MGQAPSPSFNHVSVSGVTVLQMNDEMAVILENAIHEHHLANQASGEKTSPALFNLKEKLNNQIQRTRTRSSR